MSKSIILYTKNFADSGFISRVSKFVTGGHDSKAGKLTTGLGLAGAAVGLGGGLIGIAKQLSDKTRYVVVFKSVNGLAKRINIKAMSSIDAINMAKSKAQGSGYKAFRIPEQEHEALQYYESISK